MGAYIFMVSYSRKKSKIFDKIVVTTDINEISYLHNIEAPFIRPKSQTIKLEFYCNKTCYKKIIKIIKIKNFDVFIATPNIITKI